MTFHAIVEGKRNAHQRKRKNGDAVDLQDPFVVCIVSPAGRFVSSRGKRKLQERINIHDSFQSNVPDKYGIVM